jgi:hypothetical protein
MDFNQFTNAAICNIIDLYRPLANSNLRQEGVCAVLPYKGKIKLVRLINGIAQQNQVGHERYQSPALLNYLGIIFLFI